MPWRQRAWGSALARLVNTTSGKLSRHGIAQLSAVARRETQPDACVDSKEEELSCHVAIGPSEPEPDVLAVECDDGWQNCEVATATLRCWVLRQARWSAGHPVQTSPVITTAVSYRR
eukprot:COSAG02_NODE_5508_length_4271_cov_1.557047_3_plen_117_part_00